MVSMEFPHTLLLKVFDCAEKRLPQEAKLKSVVMRLGLLTSGKFQVQILVHKLC